MKIQELRNKRAAKAKEARKIIDDAGDNFSAENQAACDALYAEIDRIDAQISTFQRQMELEASLDRPENMGKHNAERSGNSVDQETANHIRDMAIFGNFIRGGPNAISADDQDFMRSRIRGDQSVGDPTKGGYTVPRDFQTQVLAALKAYGGMRSVANVINTATGRGMDWPTIDETAAVGEIVGENASVSSVSDVSFGSVSIDSYKYSSKPVAVSFELLQDSAIDVVALVRGLLVTRIGRITNTHFTTGDGLNKPRGVVTAAPIGKTTVGGQVTSIITDDLIDMEHTIDPAHRNTDCGWMFHDNVLKVLKKLKDSTGRPLWLPGLSSADPDTLLRYRYTINQDMASALTANADSILFGNFKNYLIRDIMDVTLFRFEDSVYTTKGQVGFLMFSRHDGDLVAADSPIKKLRQAAA